MIECNMRTTSKYSFMGVDGCKEYTDEFFSLIPTLYSFSQFESLTKVCGMDEAFLVIEEELLNK